MTTSYDFIVVGSGPAGCILSSKLAKTKAKPFVLLIEAGPGNNPADVDWLADRYMTFAQQPTLNWQYKTVPQKHLNDRIVDYSRGRGLGGSTNINFGAYSVGPKDDYDRWASLMSDPSFSWSASITHRKRYEKYHTTIAEKYDSYYRPDMSLHGDDGDLHIGMPAEWETPTTELMDAAEEAGLGIKLDLNDGQGFGLAACVATSTPESRRCTAASAFLAGVPDNLTVLSGTLVTKVLFDGTRAIGVQTDQTTYHSKHETILCAGAIDTPKLLLLSGIGDRSSLTSHNIPPLIHLPGVGQNLQDHPMFILDWEMAPSFHSRGSAASTSASAVAADRAEFAATGTGPLAVLYNSMGMGFFRTSAATLFASPAFAALPAAEQEHMRRPSIPTWEIVTMAPTGNPAAQPDKSYLSLFCFTHCVQSRGSVTLASGDVRVAPLSDPNLLGSEFDRVNAVETVRRVMQFVKTPALAGSVVAPLNVPASESEEDILEWCRKNAAATWHPSCTVKMGLEEDPMACVDGNFRVYGTQGLRIADMSVTPFMFNCHTQAVAYWIGAVAADKIVREYGLDR